MKNKRVMILSLTHGESDLPFQRQSIYEQTGCDIEHVEIANLPNLSAHATLYSKLMAAAEEFDAFVKLDGDMVLREKDAIARMTAAICPRTDMLTFPVLDFGSLTPIYGLHVFSPRCEWQLDALREPRVDPAPSMPGRAVIMKPRSWSPAYHNYFMSKKQAFAFGAHRAYKAFGPHNESKGPEATQLRVLYKVWAAFLQTRDPIRGATMVAAERVRRVAKDLQPFPYKDISQFSDVWTLATNGTFDEIQSYCTQYWTSWPSAWIAFKGITTAPNKLLNRARQSQRVSFDRE